VRTLTIETFLEQKREAYKLELLTDSARSHRDIIVREVNRPGLCLAGHTRNFLDDRIQILGETEISFLESMSDERQREALDRLFRFKLNCIIVSKALELPPYLLEYANVNTVPVLRTPLSTTPFLHSLTESTCSSTTWRSVVSGSSTCVRSLASARFAFRNASKSYCVSRSGNRTSITIVTDWSA
jgi:HPr kinase/phosphorylase